MIARYQRGMRTCSPEQTAQASDELRFRQTGNLAMVSEAQAALHLGPALPSAPESVRIDETFQRRPHECFEWSGFMRRRKERDKGWRLYLLAWIPLALMGTLLAACVAFSKFSLRIDGLPLGAVMMNPLLTAVGLSLVAGEREWGWRFGFAVLSVSQFELLASFAGPLSYIAASADLPLQDANFALFDRLLGLDWRVYYNFIMARPELIPYARLSYAALALSPFSVPLALCLTGHFVRLQQFVIATVLSVALAAAISTVLPALGTYAELGLPAKANGFSATGYLVQLEDLPVLRAGGLRALDLTRLKGIITFPSFHAAAGILAIWGVWCVWWLRPAVLIVYGGMLLSTPLMGGHYFVDVIAGVGLAAFAIGASRCASSLVATLVPMVV
jgi:hypothetical protein